MNLDLKYILFKISNDVKYTNVVGTPQKYFKLDRTVSQFDYVLLCNKDTENCICLVSNQILPKIIEIQNEFSLVENNQTLKEFLIKSCELKTNDFKLFTIFQNDRRDVEIYELNDI